MERNSILERQQEGISIAKANGIYKGRIKNTFESKEKFLEKYPNVVSYLNRKIPPTLLEIAKLTDCSKNTVQKVKKKLNIDRV
jgi:DNA invertase Pin-like site-specific DNA recombinase